MWILIVAGVLLLFYLYRIRNTRYWQNRGVPLASNPHWLFGHYKEVIFGKKHIRDLVLKVYNDYPDASVVGYLKTSTPELLVKDLELIKAVLISDFASFSKNEFCIDKETDFLLAFNPFNTHGEQWKSTRAHATPSLTYSKLKTYLPCMQQVGDELVKYINGKCDNRGLVELETKQLFEMYTTDIMGYAVCGVENNTFQNENSVFAAITKSLFNNTVIGNLKIMAAFVFPEISLIIKNRLSSETAEVLLLEIVRKVMKERNSNETRNDVFQVMKSFRENDKEGVITDKYIASQLFTLMVDLYETSSTVIAFTIFELAWQSEIQEKLRKEIRDTKANINREFTNEDIDGLKYLDMVLSEILRLYTPLSFINKVCTADYNMQIDGNRTVKIEKGTVLTIPIVGIHTDPKYYTDPQKFDPERFSPEAVASRHKFSFIPFGEGPRMCVGRRLVTLEMKVAIIKILENFRLKPSAKSNYPVEFDPAIFLLSRPLNGAHIYFEKLNV